MKRIFLFCLLALVLGACKKDKADNGCSAEEFQYRFGNNKKVDTTHRIGGAVIATLDNGPDIVFNYHYYSSVCPSIADDGHTDWLVLQVPAGTTAFDYNTTDLQAHNCYFTRSCFCANVASRNVTGRIKGTRMSDSKWSVEVNVTEPINNTQLSFNKQFVLE